MATQNRPNLNPTARYVSYANYNFYYATASIPASAKFSRKSEAAWIKTAAIVWN